MQAKLLNRKGTIGSLGATGLSPADFPLGSPESRAIARSLVEKANQLPELSEYDSDCLRLYGGEVYLDATMSPSYRELESTVAYARGRDLRLARNGRVVPEHKPKAPRSSDLLRFADVQRRHSRAITEFKYGVFIDAWQRQLPEMPCPLKLEGGKLFRRINHKHKTAPPRPRVPADPGYDWEEATDVQPEEG